MNALEEPTVRGPVTIFEVFELTGMDGYASRAYAELLIRRRMRQITESITAGLTVLVPSIAEFMERMSKVVKELVMLVAGIRIEPRESLDRTEYHRRCKARRRRR